MDQPDLGMPSRDYYLKPRNDTMLMAYQTMLEEMIGAFGADPAVAKQDAKEIVDFEIELANVSIAHLIIYRNHPVHPSVHIFLCPYFSLVQLLLNG